MWREEVGFHEMFLAYFEQYQTEIGLGKKHREFLYHILDYHEAFILQHCKTVPHLSQQYELSGGSYTQKEWEEMERIKSAAEVLDPPADDNRLLGSFVEGTATKISVKKEDFKDCPDAFSANLDFHSPGDSVMEEAADRLLMSIPKDRYNEALDFKARRISEPVWPLDAEPSLSRPRPSMPQSSRGNRDPRTCRFCFKTFNQPWEVVRHERCHTGEKPFVCSVCGRAFSVKNNLSRHQVTHLMPRHRLTTRPSDGDALVKSKWPFQPLG